MPLPIICASADLCQFALLFSLVFTKPQWKYLVTVLLALIRSEDRRTLTGLLRKVLAQFNWAGPARFLAKSPWSDTFLAQLWLAHFRLQLESCVQAEHRRQQVQQAQLGRRCPLPPQLYRTKGTCEKEDVPFQSKIDLADAGIQDLVSVAREHVHGLVDAWYTFQRL